jgi:hypothetical protein
MLTSKFRGTNLREGNHVYQVQMTYGTKQRYDDVVRNNHESDNCMQVSIFSRFAYCLLYKARPSVER